MKWLRPVAFAVVTAGVLASCAQQPGPSRSLSTATRSAAARKATPLPPPKVDGNNVKVPATRAATSPPPSPDPSEKKPASDRPHTETRNGAAAVLATLAVKGRAPMTGYDRNRFGTAWTDDNTDFWGHNGCDTRNDILRRDLTALTIKSDSNGCTVLAGVLSDPYTGRRIEFSRGVRTSTAVEIDHVVALGDAWQTGAQQMSARARQNYANDPLVLLAVDGPTNMGKGDGDAATWLPPNRRYRCDYVARQVAIKHKYGLWVTPAEKDAMTLILSACPEEKLPTIAGESQNAPARFANTQPGSKPSTASTTRAQPSGRKDGGKALDRRYPTCAAANAAGYGPYVRGQDLEYSWYRDADGDGTDCEP